MFYVNSDEERELERKFEAEFSVTKRKLGAGYEG